MNKKHWITILLDDSITEAKTLDFLDMSYDLINNGKIKHWSSQQFLDFYGVISNCRFTFCLFVSEFSCSFFFWKKRIIIYNSGIDSLDAQRLSLKSKTFTTKWGLLLLARKHQIWKNEFTEAIVQNETLILLLALLQKHEQKNRP